MNNDYMNDEMEIDLIELLKHLLRKESSAASDVYKRQILKQY